MEKDKDANSISEAGKSSSVPGFLRKGFTEELEDDNENPEILFPPFFIQLPTELKLKILDFVSGVDLAKVSCVCSELSNLASGEDLWKQKYVTQFGNYEGSGSERSFEKRFSKAWKERKRSSLNIMRRNSFNPFDGDFGEDGDHEWLNIVHLCLPTGFPVPTLGNGNAVDELSNCNLNS